MKKIFRTPFAFLVLVIAALFIGCKHTDTDTATARAVKTPQRKAPAWQIGVAEVEITAPLGYRMAGYFNERLATGIHDPLKAKAIFLQQGDEQVALVFCDLVEVKLSVTDPARAEASAKTGIPAANILICATHTHTGPLYDDVRYDYFHNLAIEKTGKDAAETIDYPKFFIGQLVKAISQAKANAKPGELEVAVAEQKGISFNRRFWMKDGKVRFNPGILNTNIVRPAGPIDPDLPIIVARHWGSSVGLDGAFKQELQPVGIISVFAMHADTVGGTEYGADYPFFIQQTLREKLGKDVVSMFGAGTCGDINHIDVSRKRDVKGYELTQELGTTIGKTILASLPNLHEVKPMLAARSKTFIYPLQEVTPQQLADAREKMKLSNPLLAVESVKFVDLAKRGKEWPVEVQVFRLGDDTAIVGLPGEIFVELGLAIKKASPFKNTIVMSICNDRPNYVPTKKAFAEGSYEVTNSRLKPGGGEAMVDAAKELLNELKLAK